MFIALGSISANRNSMDQSTPAGPAQRAINTPATANGIVLS